MRFLTLAVLPAVMIASAAHASVVQIDQSAFTPGAGLITFSEFPVGTSNPVYAPATYGGGAGSPTVTFGGYFTGQTAGVTNPSSCPAGAAVTGCVLGTPTGPLSIAPNSPATFIATDSDMPTSPVLSGTPQFNGSIAILFSTPQSGVGLTGGYFDALASTAITVFDSSGATIGQLSNNTLGDEFLGLVTSDGSADISGILFSLVGPEPAGFDVDNISFGVGSQVTIPTPPTPTPPTGVPEPASFALLSLGIASLGLMRRRDKV